MVILFFFLKAKTRSFIKSQVDLEGHDPPKKLQTMGGDQPKHRIDPNPITDHSELTHVHRHYKNVEHNLHQKK